MFPQNILEEKRKGNRNMRAAIPAFFVGPSKPSKPVMTAINIYFSNCSLLVSLKESEICILDMYYTLDILY